MSAANVMRSIDKSRTIDNMRKLQLMKYNQEKGD